MREAREAEPERRGAAFALWATLALLLLLRVVLAVPGAMAGWGISLLRFAPPRLGGALWLLAAAALIPAIGRWLLPHRPAPRGAILFAAAAALVCAALVWIWPDRLHFVGDYLLREGTVARALSPAGLFPQALPLDVFLHYHVPRALVAWFSVPTDVTERGLGVLEAAAIGLLGFGFARVLRVEGARALAVGLAAACGGFLGLDTGYGKSIAEVTLLTLAMGVFALRAQESPRALAGVGVVAAAGLALHRSGLALLPVAGLAAFLSLRRHPRAWRDPATFAGLTIAGVVAAVMLPRIVTVMRRYDPVHFTTLERPGALVAGPRLLDLANLAILLAPLAPAIPVLAAALGRRTWTSSTGWLLATLAVPWIGMTLLLHPSQGMFRDWDDYGPLGAALSLIAAWQIVEATRARGWSWLALPAALATLASTVPWLAISADVDRGMARIHAYLDEPPRRSDAERGRVWDFLGIRNAQLGRWDDSAEAMAEAAKTSPSPRVLLQWALAEQARGNAAVARDLFRRVTLLTPGDARAWYGLAAEAWNLGDEQECRRAAERLAALRPGNPEARQILESLDRARSERGATR